MDKLPDGVTADDLTAKVWTVQRWSRLRGWEDYLEETFALGEAMARVKEWGEFQDRRTWRILNVETDDFIVADIL